MNCVTCCDNQQVRAYSNTGVQLAIAEQIEPGRWIAHLGSDGRRVYGPTAREAILGLLGIVVVARIASVDFVAIQYSDGSVEYQDKPGIAPCKPVNNLAITGGLDNDLQPMAAGV